jgi:hypothetical protein
MTKRICPALRDKGRRPSERARGSQFKPGDKIKVTADGESLVFKAK